MERTSNLKLPYIMAAQAQKHVTHNEALRSLDALVQLCVEDRDLQSPPASPTEGQRYIVATGATGAWAGKFGMVAAWQDGAWAFMSPRTGWLAWIADEGVVTVFDGSAWTAISRWGAAAVEVNVATSGASTTLALLEDELTLTGASVSSSIAIPERAIVLAVTTRTTETVNGATSYDCGIAGEVDKYGGLLGTAQGATNRGVTAPTAFYADQPIVLTANGGAFTGGKVRIGIHFISCAAASS